jgi:hypothetical protein
MMQRVRHCEERSDVAIQLGGEAGACGKDGLLRCARNDGGEACA